MLNALGIAVLGMVVVFLVLGLNYGLIVLLGLLRPREAAPCAESREVAPAPESPPPDAPPPVQTEEETEPAGEYIDPRILAAVTAAVRAYERDETTSSL